MAHDIRLQSIACSEGNHDICEMKDCYCEHHLPQNEQSIRWRLEELGKSTLPDSARLQVLIELVTEWARRV